MSSPSRIGSVVGLLCTSLAILIVFAFPPIIPQNARRVRTGDKSLLQRQGKMTLNIVAAIFPECGRRITNWISPYIWTQII